MKGCRAFAHRFSHPGKLFDCFAFGRQSNERGCDLGIGGS
jgi:hypothetical protein